MVAFALSLLGIGKAALAWLGRQDWRIIAIVGLAIATAWCWRGWSKEADARKAEVAAHTLTRASLAELIAAGKRMIAAGDRLRKASQDAVGASQDAERGNLAVADRLDRIVAVRPVSGQCVTPHEVMQSGL